MDAKGVFGGWRRQRALALVRAAGGAEAFSRVRFAAATQVRMRMRMRGIADHGWQLFPTLRGWGTRANRANQRSDRGCGHGAALAKLCCPRLRVVFEPERPRHVARARAVLMHPATRLIRLDSETRPQFRAGAKRYKPAIAGAATRPHFAVPKRSRRQCRGCRGGASSEREYPPVDGDGSFAFLFDLLELASRAQAGRGRGGCDAPDRGIDLRVQQQQQQQPALPRARARRATCR